MQFGVWIPNCRPLATPEIIRRAAEIGAAWHPIHPSAEEPHAGRAEIGGLCELHGRAVPPTVTLRNAACALRTGRPVPTSVQGGSVLAGEPAALVDRIGELGSAGVEHLVLEFLADDGVDFDEQIALFAERVRPQLA